MEKTPIGKPRAVTALPIAVAISSDVPGCPGWALTITGQPAANAEAVSAPATENANGKLLAAQTATGPMGARIRRRSGFRSGLRSSIARSMLAARHVPCRTTSANMRN